MAEQLRTRIRQVLFDDPLPPEVRPGVTAEQVDAAARRACNIDGDGLVEGFGLGAQGACEAEQGDQAGGGEPGHGAGHGVSP